MCVFLSDWCGVAGGEQAGSAPQLSFPPGRVGALQNLDDVAGAELQLVRLLSLEAVQSSDLQPGGGYVLGTGEETRDETHKDRRTDTQSHSMNLNELYRVITIFFWGTTSAFSFNFPFRVC